MSFNVPTVFYEWNFWNVSLDSNKYRKTTGCHFPRNLVFGSRTDSLVVGWVSPCQCVLSSLLFGWRKGSYIICHIWSDMRHGWKNEYLNIKNNRHMFLSALCGWRKAMYYVGFYLSYTVWFNQQHWWEDKTFCHKNPTRCFYLLCFWEGDVGIISNVEESGLSMTVTFRD